MEKHVGNTAFDAESDKSNIEHILPESPGEEWVDYDEHRDEKFIYRLGNMTLMDAAANRKIGNDIYAVKRKAYEKSDFAITKKIAEEYVEWNTDKIAARQNWLARQATSIWRVDF